MKRVFRKQPLAEASISTDVASVVGLVGVCRQQVNAPVSMLGWALSVGATASVVSLPGLALATEGSSVVVLPAPSDVIQNASPSLGANTLGQTDYYTVSEGDTLWHIAAQHQADVNVLKAANGISQGDVLREGQVLRVPNESLTLADTPEGAVGGEDLVMTEAPTSMALLSADETEQGWVSLDVESEEQEDLDAQAEALEEAEALALNELEDSEAEASQTEADLATASIDSAWSAPVDTAAQPEVVVAAAPTTGLESVNSAPWQDAAVDLAVAPEETKAEESTPQIATAEAATQTTTDDSALPMSMALHGPTESDSTARRPSQSVATLPVTEPTADQSSPPQAKPEAVAVVAPESSSPVADAPRSRDQVIQDHLARIRESNGSVVDRDALNERIRQARLELERSRTGAEPVSSAPQASPNIAEVSRPVTQSSALSARESTFVSEAPRAEVQTPVLPNLPNQRPASAAPSTNLEASGTRLASQQVWTVTDAATEVEAGQPVAVATEVRLPNLPTAPSNTPNTRGVDGPSVLAAAPMGAEAYRPFPSVETGQTVSPGMPMLPGADSFLPEAPNRFNGYIWPTHGTFTSGYGWRWGRMHRGIDVAGPVGTPIVASASGVVVRSGWNSGGYGNLVDIRHPDGSLTRYAHNSRLLVREGQQVAQGQQIAEMGSTGRSTGPHLHFEIHLPGTGTVNPMAHLPGR
ncbi:MAG: hypothetical protein RLZZ597_2099 [Cyanobacteriota bacterium]